MPTISQIELNNNTYDIRDLSIKVTKDPQTFVRYDPNNPNRTEYGWINNINSITNKWEEFGATNIGNETYVQNPTSCGVEHFCLTTADHEIHHYTLDFSFSLKQDIPANKVFTILRLKKWNYQGYVEGTNSVDWNIRKRWFVFPEINIGGLSITNGELLIEVTGLYSPNGSTALINARNLNELKKLNSTTGETLTYPLKINWTAAVPLNQRNAEYYWSISS